ncbi:MAG: hypothetical protein AAGA92_07045 [Planctomycetota bacterium]
MALTLGSVLVIGCSRTHYRRQADAEANRIIQCRAETAGSDPTEFRIEIDPRSRMFDPHDPDCEPRPPDDPLANEFLKCVDCKKGSKCWRHLPKTPFVENPSWQEQLPRDARGRVVLDTRASVDLALVHSPDFQSELETLYLSALDLSFERFRFDTQFFGGSETILTVDGRDRSGTGQSSTLFEATPLRAGANRLRAERLTATGAELVVGMANSLVWQFAGPDDYSSTTLLDFSLVQPLLRAGGRTVVLERLTISERALLANIRQMERFRRGFYLNIVTGQFPGQGPTRRGGFFGGSGLEGFAGVGGGGFGNLGNQLQGQGFSQGFGGGGGGGGFTGGAGAAGAGGFLGILQSAQTIRNQRSNVTALRGSVEQLRASYDANRIDRFQVDLANQALLNAQSQLLTSETFFDQTLENFKITLGLPPEIPVQLADETLSRFELLDPALDEARNDLAGALGLWREMRDAGEGAGDAMAGMPNALAEAAEVLGRLSAVLDACEEDINTLEAALPDRKASLARLAERPEVAEARIDPMLFSGDKLQERFEAKRLEFYTLKDQILTRAERLAVLVESEEAPGPAELVRAGSELNGLLLEIALVQASVRLDAISFDEIDLEFEEALRIAAAYRRDWQNARAALVDAWRLIYFNANDLLSDLDIVFSGDIGNVSDNPFDLRGTNGRLRVGLEFDAPITRLAERNVYRQSLIEFQQARRNYYRFRDRVYQGLRNTLRQVRLNEVNLELRRAAVQVAIAQVDLTQLRLSQPPLPGETAQFNNTTARDLVQSLSDLLNVQNDLLSVWVNFQVQRLGLEFDLGVMQLDAAGQHVPQTSDLRAYLAGAKVNLTDIYPGTKSPEGESGGVPVEPLPLGEPIETEGFEAEEPVELEPLPPPLANRGGGAVEALKIEGSEPALVPPDSHDTSTELVIVRPPREQD